MTYVDRFVLPIPQNKLNEYRSMAEGAGKIWIEHGASSINPGQLQLSDLILFLIGSGKF